MILAESHCSSRTSKIAKESSVCILLPKNPTTAAEFKLFVSARVAEIQETAEVDDLRYIKAQSTLMPFRLETHTF